MLKLTEIKRSSTTDVTAFPIRLNRHAITKVESAADPESGQRLKVFSDELSTMLCEGSIEDFDEQIRELEAKEAGDPEATADAIAGLLALVEALTARVEELEAPVGDRKTNMDIVPATAHKLGGNCWPRTDIAQMQAAAEASRSGGAT